VCNGGRRGETPRLLCSALGGAVPRRPSSREFPLRHYTARRSAGVGVWVVIPPIHPPVHGGVTEPRPVFVDLRERVAGGDLLVEQGQPELEPAASFDNDALDNGGIAAHVGEQFAPKAVDDLPFARAFIKIGQPVDAGVGAYLAVGGFRLTPFA